MANGFIWISFMGNKKSIGLNKKSKQNCLLFIVTTAGLLCDPIKIRFENSTGSVLSVFTGDVDEVYSSTISWSSTATTLTFVYDDGNEDDVATYNFITDDQLRVTDTEDGFEVILDRVD
jgi:hypothetical protein